MFNCIDDLCVFNCINDLCLIVLMTCVQWHTGDHTIRGWQLYGMPHSTTSYFLVHICLHNLLPELQSITESLKTASEMRSLPYVASVQLVTRKLRTHAQPHLLLHGGGNYKRAIFVKIIEWILVLKEILVYSSLIFAN